MRVEELTGAQLDYWVAKADPRRSDVRWERHAESWIGFTTIGSSPEFPALIVTSATCLRERATLRDAYLSATFYQPSQDWKVAGPIIERENIQISPPTSPVHRYGGPNAGNGQSGSWSACTWHRGADGRRAIAHDEKSALVAAMRCFVRLKFGETVPDEVSA